ncbi:hypothetical protein [Enterococcus thailandicus]|uniref:hypothetical protein n=1 Tax=Enterococcus thailandicus TaxID=417368 RepID=UPI001C4D4676|nr:hypothetical protein [Enterococcus thailandicus]
MYSAILNDNFGCLFLLGTCLFASLIGEKVPSAVLNNTSELTVKNDSFGYF